MLKTSQIVFIFPPGTPRRRKCITLNNRSVFTCYLLHYGCNLPQTADASCPIFTSRRYDVIDVKCERKWQMWWMHQEDNVISLTTVWKHSPHLFAFSRYEVFFLRKSYNFYTQNNQWTPHASIFSRYGRRSRRTCYVELRFKWLFWFCNISITFLDKGGVAFNPWRNQPRSPLQGNNTLPWGVRGRSAQVGETGAGWITFWFSPRSG